MNARILGTLALMAVLGVATPSLNAYCDTMNGPVVKAARQPLESGDLTPALKWVPKASVKPGDVVELLPSAMEIPVVEEEMLTRGVTASWLERQGARLRVVSTPRREDSDADIREDLIVEYYTR